MGRKLSLELAVLLAFFGLLWLGFSFLPWFNHKPALPELDIEQEEKLGRIMADDVFLRMPGCQLLHNATVDSAIRIIEQRLRDQLPQSPYDYRIRVIDNPDANAVTFPGGNIFIFSGLFAFAESAEEVAAVLAHEMGHVEKKHTLSKLLKEVGLSVLFSILTGGDPQLISELTQTLVSNAFDRRAEEEADDFALALMEKASLDPQYLGRFFERIRTRYGDYGKIGEVIMTHPHHAARIEKSEEYTTGSEFVHKPLHIRWEKIRESVAE